MTQVNMPEPVTYAHFTPEGLIRMWSREKTNLQSVTDYLEREPEALITTTQAEAYANARVKEAQQWISVETLLPPDDGKEVLAIRSDGEVEIVYGYLILETHCDKAYTHWMPIPDHPTVE